MLLVLLRCTFVVAVVPIRTFVVLCIHQHQVVSNAVRLHVSAVVEIVQSAEIGSIRNVCVRCFFRFLCFVVPGKKCSVLQMVFVHFYARINANHIDEFYFLDFGLCEHEKNINN